MNYFMADYILQTNTAVAQLMHALAKAYARLSLVKTQQLFALEHYLPVIEKGLT